jgi:methyltransferase-like protein
MEKADNKDDNESINIVSKKEEWKNKRKGFYIEAKINDWLLENGYNYLPVTTILVNNSSDTIRYATYSCSWDMNYETDNKLLPLYGVECDKNVPKVITILPFSMDTEKKLEIRTKIDTAQLVGHKLRMGFNYIPVKFGEDGYDKTKLLFKHDHLIWSDTLVIK